MTVDRSVTIRLRVSSAEFDAAMARAGMEVTALRAEIDAAGRSAGGSGSAGLAKLGSTADDGAKQIHALSTSIALVGPALIPLAGGLLGLSSSLVGIGTVGVLGFKGANAEIQKGTVLGAQFAGSMATANSALKSVEQTAAGGIFTGVEQSVDKLNAKLPELNDFVAKVSPEVGDILQHVAGGVIDLFTAAEPLILAAEKDVDALAARFESWAQGPGGAKFFSMLADDMPPTLSAIENLLGTAGHVLAGYAPVGQTVLQIIDGISGALNEIPIPIITAGAFAFTAWKIQATLAAGANALMQKTGIGAASAVSELALAESRAALGIGEATIAANLNSAAMARMAEASAAARAAATGAMPLGGAAGAGAGARGLLGGVAAGAMDYAIPALIAGFALRAAANSTSGLESSNNPAARLAGGTADLLSSVFTKNPMHLFSNIGGAIGRESSGDQAASRNEQRQGELNDYFAQLSYAQKFNADHFVDEDTRGRLATQLQNYESNPYIYKMPTSMPTPLLQDSTGYYQSAGYQYAQQNNAGLSAAGSLLNKGIDAKPIGDVADGFKSYTDALQKNIDAESKWNDTTGKTVKIQGLGKVNQDLWEQALEKTNYNMPDAINLIQGHQDALAADKQQMSEAQQEQQRINSAVAEAATRYHLTADQVATYASALGITNSQLGSSIQTNVNFADAIGKVAAKLANGNDAVQGWLGAVQTFDASAGGMTDKATLLGAGLQALQGVTLGMETTNLSAAGSAETLSNTIEQNSKSVSKNGDLLGQLTKTAHGYVVTQPQLTAGSLNIAQAMSQAGSSAISLAESIYRNTGNVNDALGAYDGLRAQFKSTMIQAGYTASAAENLATQIFGIPKDAKTFVALLGKNDVQAAIGDLTATIAHLDKDIQIQLGLAPANAATRVQNEIDQIHGKSVSVEVTYSGDAITGKTFYVPGYGPHTEKAGGGYINGPGTGTSDSINARLSNGEFVSTAATTAKNRAALEAANRGAMLLALPGFASGGMYADGYTPPSLATGSSSSSSTSSAAAKAKKSLADLLAALNSEMGSIGSGPVSPQIDINSTGVTRVVSQIDQMSAKIKAALADGLSPKSAKPLEAELAKLAAMAQQQLGSLKLHIDTTDVAALKKSLTGTADEIKAAFATLVADAKNAGVPSAQLSKLTAASNKIADQLGTENQKLADLVQQQKDYQTTLAQSLNNFNIATDQPGSGPTAPAAITSAGLYAQAQNNAIINPLQTAATNAATLAATQLADAQDRAAELQKLTILGRTDLIAGAQAALDAAAAQAAISAQAAQDAAAAAKNAQAATTAGGTGAAGLITDLQATVDKATLFGQEMAQLTAEGLNTTSLQQLGDAGDTDATMQRLQELLAASPAQIQQINDLTAQLATTASTVGGQVAGSLYDAGIAAGQGIVDGLKSQEGAIEKQIVAMVDSVVATIKTELKINSPSQVTAELGMFTGLGFGLGLTSSIPHIAAAASNLAAAATGAGLQTYIPAVSARPLATAGGMSGEIIAELRSELAALRAQLPAAIFAAARENAAVTVDGVSRGVTDGVGRRFDRVMSDSDRRRLANDFAAAR